jgi:hypothetical protein
MQEIDWEELMNPMKIHKLTNFPFFIRGKKILLIGAGGGGDVCGCLPTYFWLQQLGAIPMLGSLTWERSEVYKNYGPVKFENITGLESIHGTVAIGNHHTKIKNTDISFQASRISTVLNQTIIFLDISKGVRTLAQDLEKFSTDQKIDFIVPIDVGGDIIARGTERGLKSPLADAMILATIHLISKPKLLGIFGINCDGELTLEEIDGYFIEFNQNNWFLGARFHEPKELEYMEDIIAKAGAITEASYQPLRYLRGERGMVTIRGGTRTVQLEPEIMNTYFFSVDDIFAQCPIAQAIMDCPSIELANEKLLTELKLVSEYEEERRIWGINT